ASTGASSSSPMRSTGTPARMPRISLTLSRLVVASRSRRTSASEDRADDRALQFDELTDAAFCQTEELVEDLALEGRGFGGALYFDEPPVARLDDVHVDVGARVFFVRQIEHRDAADHADAGRGNVIGDRNALQLSLLPHLLECEHERHESASDRGGASAA